jgi:integrase
MAHQFSPDPTFLDQHGYGSVAHVPFILSANMRYEDDVNRYLRERATVDWHPNHRDGSPCGRVKVPSENTLAAIADDLENFLTYCEVNDISWRDLDYRTLLETYQADMLSGAWSVSGQPLAHSTVNRRVGSVCELLLWASDQKLRLAFNVVRSRVRIHDRSGTAISNRYHVVEERAGKVRQHPSRLRIPTIAEIERWLAEIEVRRGMTKALACRSIIEMGWRLEEAALARVWQLPDPGEIEPGYPARMEICYGTKGDRQPGDPQKKGKLRTLRFDAGFLRKLDDYKRLRRAKALALFGRLYPGKPKPDILFLSEQTGEPVTPAALYKAWHECKTLPFEGWSPHTGRHAFACLTLLRLVRDEACLIGQATSALPKSVLLELSTNLISTYIRPVLGHVSEQTSTRYLEWLADHFMVAEHRAAWARFLEDVDD